MNSLNTFYFPATNIYTARQLPLFLLFQNIHLIQPAEKSPGLNENQIENELVAKGLCQIHTPCPLGEHRDRFLHLVNDIKNRKDDYASQLSALTLGSMSGIQSEDKESRRNIISDIFTPSQIRKAQSSENDKLESLWNIRLILAIAEILDQEEEEIARGLSILEDDEASLYKTLHGDDDDEEESPLAELIQLQKNLITRDTNSQRVRTNGWIALFQEFQSETVDILLTTSQVSGDVVIEKFERKSELLPLHLPPIDLPGIISWHSQSLIPAVNDFSVQHSDLLEQLAAGFQEILSKESVTKSELENSPLLAVAQQWNREINQRYPAAAHGRAGVAGYVLPAVSAPQIFEKSISGQDKRCNTLLFVVE